MSSNREGSNNYLAIASMPGMFWLLMMDPSGRGNSMWWHAGAHECVRIAVMVHLHEGDVVEVNLLKLRAIVPYLFTAIEG